MGLPAGLRRIGGAAALSTVLAACASGGASVEPSASPRSSEPASESPLITPPASATASAAAGESSAPSESEAAERTVDVTSPVEFSMTVPAEWKGSPELSSSTTRTFVAGIDRWVLFTQTAPSTADEWVERLSSGDFTASEPEIVEIGDASGVRLDVSVPDGQDDVVLIREAFGDWSMEAGRPSRFWILEVGGEVLVILTDAPERAFDSWTETVEDVLSTIVWAQ